MQSAISATQGVVAEVAQTVAGIAGEISGAINGAAGELRQVVLDAIPPQALQAVRDVQDAVGEITNMISGQARAGLSQLGLNLSSSTPTVIFGDNHTIPHVTSGPVIAIPFSSPQGDFTVEFCFD